MPIALNDERGHITYLTPSFTRTFGYDLRDIPTLLDWWPKAYPDPEYRDWIAAEWQRRIEKARRDASPFEPVEVIIRCKDGTRPMVIGGAAPLVGAVEGTHLVTLYDITDRKLTEAALREANLQLAEADRRKDEFLAVLSHELRNPLTPIRNSLYVLEQPQSNREQRGQALAIIGRQVSHLSRLVDDLLDVTRITQGKIRLQRRRLDLVDVVCRTVEDHRSLLEEREVIVQLPKKEVWIDGDPTRLAQTLGNLLTNAAKFTPAQGRVTVSLIENEEDAVLEIADTGVGIDSETLARIFEPFAQADRSLDRSRGGLGLGLALVKGMVELHGGQAVAHSDGPGRGARFAIRLPLDQRKAAEQCGPSCDAVRKIARRVLIIEDNSDAADSLRDSLALMGHEVAVAYDGTTGLEQVREFTPHVILCDIGLPGVVDGYEVARAVRRDPSRAGVFLLALSGYVQPDDQQKAHQAGFDAHVAKPPDLLALGRLLASTAIWS